MKPPQEGGDFDATIHLPGALQNQGFGEEVSVRSRWIGEIKDNSWFNSPRYEADREPGHVRIPFWLQPDRRFIGSAWVERNIMIPQEFLGQRAVLHLERVHWVTEVWLDGRRVGLEDSLSVPHEYDLGLLAPGEHTLRIRVDNGMYVGVGENAHSVSDHTQGAWNGMVGQIKLVAMPGVWLEDVQVWPEVAPRKARVTIRIGTIEGKAGTGELHWESGKRKGSLPVRWTAEGGSAEWEVVFPGDTPLWDEFSPELLRLHLALVSPAGKHERSISFGLRKISAEGRQFKMNGRNLFFRGTLECCIFPLTGYPPTDVEAWRRIIRICKAHGLNHIRFHSWCPPEAAFVAADEEGFYYQVESAIWTYAGSDARLNDWVYRETDRILKAYGNHPSFVLMACGNELGGAKEAQWLNDWIQHGVAKDSRRLFTSASGYPEAAANQYTNIHSPRIQRWGEGLNSRLNKQPPATLADYRAIIEARNTPVISHEIGQWCVFPNFDEITKYTGPLKAKNFEVFRDSLQAAHMGDQTRDFLMASGKLQALCYKEEIESALRTKGMGGFQLLDLHDFPGQGTALVGVLDAFWEEKGYILPEEYRRFCGPVVPLLRLPARTFTSAETLSATVELAHYGAAPLTVRPQWTLRDSQGKAVCEGRLESRVAPVDNGIPLGRISIPLEGLATPARYNLEVRLEGADAANDWDIWVFPDNVQESVGDVYVTQELDANAEARLLAGGAVLLLPPAHRFNNSLPAGFTPVFWNTAWARGQKPETLGFLCKPEHPVFAQFPTEYHQNWQWWELLKDARIMQLDDMPPALRPIVQPIDTWFENRRLGLLMEARVGKGRLVVSGMNLQDRLGERIAARQFRHSLLTYMNSPDFNPAVELTLEQVQGLLKPGSVLQRLGAEVSATSSQPGFPIENLMDGDPSTIWHSAYDPEAAPHPHEITMDLRAPQNVRGVKYTPRQDQANGRIARFEIRVSSDGQTWGEPLASGEWKNGAASQTVLFPDTMKTRLIRLTAKSEVQGGPWASVAELEPLLNE